MAVRQYKPTSPGRRHGYVLDRSDLSSERPHRALTERIARNGGRNHHGHTTTRFRGGGARKLYRVIDFKRNKDDVEGTIARLEYDPNRTCHIALIKYADGEYRYILAPRGMKVGDTVLSSERCEPVVRACMPLGSMPTGMEIHNIELHPGRGGQIVRAAGSVARSSSVIAS